MPPRARPVEAVAVGSVRRVTNRDAAVRRAGGPLGIDLPSLRPLVVVACGIHLADQRVLALPSLPVRLALDATLASVGV